MTRRILNAAGRWLVRVTGLRVVRVRIVIEDRDSRYAEGYVDGLARHPARAGSDPNVIDLGARLTRSESDRDQILVGIHDRIDRTSAESRSELERSVNWLLRRFDGGPA